MFWLYEKSLLDTFKVELAAGLKTKMYLATVHNC